MLAAAKTERVRILSEVDIIVSFHAHGCAPSPIMGRAPNAEFI
jgi:hypothetical protein